MGTDITALTHFLLELDALKSIERRTYINGGERRENSAEHSWHLAMACWTIARQFSVEVSLEKLLQLALVHDLGEIDAGDTFLYDNQRDNAHQAERECVQRLQAHPGNNIDNLSQLWEEQEGGSSEETRLLKTVDRLLPFLHNIASEGKTWRELGVRKSQVIQAHRFIAASYPQIHNWVSARIEEAVAKGWLLDA